MLVFLGAAALGAEADLRFSATLEAAERTAAGLGRLTSDQVAVIDALVRRDLARRGGSSPGDDAVEAQTAATFSGRLTAEERNTAGLAALTAGELVRLDAAIERHQSARLARTLLAPPVFLSRRPPVIPTERKTERELHGTFSLSYGFGSGGYREKTGAMTVTLDDPAKGYSLTIGYSESHIKGAVPYYLSRDPLANRPRPMIEDPMQP